MRPTRASDTYPPLYFLASLGAATSPCPLFIYLMFRLSRQPFGKYRKAAAVPAQWP